MMKGFLSRVGVKPILVARHLTVSGLFITLKVCDKKDGNRNAVAIK